MLRIGLWSKCHLVRQQVAAVAVWVGMLACTGHAAELAGRHIYHNFNWYDPIAIGESAALKMQVRNDGTLNWISGSNPAWIFQIRDRAWMPGVTSTYYVWDNVFSGGIGFSDTTISASNLPKVPGSYTMNVYAYRPVAIVGGTTTSNFTLMDWSPRTVSFVMTFPVLNPSGWVYMQPPYFYSLDMGSWFYADPTAVQNVYTFVTGQWTRLFQGGCPLNNGWVFFQWPYAYSLNAGTWSFLYEHDIFYCYCFNQGSWYDLGN